MEDNTRLLFAAYAALALLYYVGSLSSSKQSKKIKQSKEEVDRLINVSKVHKRALEVSKFNQQALDALGEEQTNEELLSTIRSVVAEKLKQENRDIEKQMTDIKEIVDREPK